MKKKLAQFTVFAVLLSIMLGYSEQMYKEQELREKDNSTKVVITTTDIKDLAKEFEVATASVLSSYTGKTISVDKVEITTKGLEGLIEKEFKTMVADNNSFLHLDNYIQHVYDPLTESKHPLTEDRYDAKGEADSTILVKEGEDTYIPLTALDFSKSEIYSVVYNEENIKIVETEIPITKKSLRESTLFNFALEDVDYSTEGEIKVVYKSDKGVILEFEWLTAVNKVAVIMYAKQTQTYPVIE